MLAIVSIMLDNRGSYAALQYDHIWGAVLPLQASDETIHMIPDQSNLMHFAFASEYVAERVFERLYQIARHQMEVFLSTSYGQAHFDVVREHLFRQFVHYVVPLGGKYELRDLQTGEACEGSFLTKEHWAAVQ